MLATNVKKTIQNLTNLTPIRGASMESTGEWGKQVVRFLNTVKDQHNVLDRADARAIMANLAQLDGLCHKPWAEWAGDWLPYTKVAADITRLEQLVPTETAVQILPASTAQAAQPLAEPSAKGKGKSWTTPILQPTSDDEIQIIEGPSTCAPPSSIQVSASDRLASMLKHCHADSGASLPNEAHQQSHQDMVTSIDLQGFNEARYVCHSCDLCVKDRKICLTIWKNGRLQVACANCCAGKIKCMWQPNDYATNIKYCLEDTLLFQASGSPLMSTSNPRPEPGTPSVVLNNSVPLPSPHPGTHSLSPSKHKKHKDVIPPAPESVSSTLPVQVSPPPPPSPTQAAPRLPAVSHLPAPACTFVDAKVQASLSIDKDPVIQRNALIFEFPALRLPEGLSHVDLQALDDIINPLVEEAAFEHGIVQSARLSTNELMEKVDLAFNWLLFSLYQQFWIVTSTLFVLTGPQVQ
ncbi:hypothetical protein EDB19DRAFT_1828740 [Suillus lakei]|nr:hypothetical protein EDB19DRAFT_1828740 [Suillus lakei]